MPNSLIKVVDRLRKPALVAQEGLSDGRLLGRFIDERDHAAFAGLVRRHGPMVWGVCRRVLGQAHDADDAFQATFLVLVKKAACVSPREAVGNWLYGVAYHTALKARAGLVKQRVREKQVNVMPEAEAESGRLWDELQPRLDQELSRLPDKYRLPIVLCDLEGRPRRDVARQFQIPEGTLSSRLTTARGLLARRLSRHGLALSAGSLAGLLTRHAVAAGAPLALTSATVKSATLLGGGAAVSPKVAALVKAAIQTMFLNQLKLATAPLLSAAMLVGGAILFFQAPADAGPQRAFQPAPHARTELDDLHAADGAVQAPAEDPTAVDMKKLEGEWKPTLVETKGKKVTAADALDLRIVIRGDNIGFKSATGEGKERKSKFKLNAKKSPKEIDILSLDGQEKGQTTLGIYELKKGAWKLCMAYFGKSDERPKEFKTTADDGVMLLTLVRVEAKADDKEANAAAPQRTPLEEFAALVRGWENADYRLHETLRGAKTPAEKEQVRAELNANRRTAVEKCLQLAERSPGTAGEIAALCFAAGHEPDSASGKRAYALLEKRVAGADMNELAKALGTAHRVPRGRWQALAPAVLDRARANAEHPQTAWLLSWVATASRGDDEDPAPRKPFAEAADLIIARHPGSADISNFCECLGAGFGSPAWAGRFETHLRAILKENRDRRVRCAASFALASVVQGGGEARQPEAEELYQRFITQFDGKHRYSYQQIENEMHRRALVQVDELQSRGIGRPAPDIDGVDLDGRPMKLSAYRGKVVLLSFWATWCFPCIKLVPHERALVARLQGKPFALVGVNSDNDADALREALTKHQITWPSFRDKQAGRPAISDEWKVLGFPTLYLIDHQGTIRKRWIGAPPAEELNRAIDTLIAGAS